MNIDIAPISHYESILIRILIKPFSVYSNKLNTPISIQRVNIPPLIHITTNNFPDTKNVHDGQTVSSIGFVTSEYH